MLSPVFCSLFSSVAQKERENTVLERMFATFKTHKRGESRTNDGTRFDDNGLFAG
jgi:hypothetical protein